MERKINLNTSFLALSNLPFGKTSNIEVKIGRKTYLVDVNKDSASAYVEIYNKPSANRSTFSKYDPTSCLHGVHTRKDALLDRDFFEHIAEIEEAQSIIRHYSDFRGIL